RSIGVYVCAATADESQTSMSRAQHRGPPEALAARVLADLKIASEAVRSAVGADTLECLVDDVDHLKFERGQFETVWSKPGIRGVLVQLVQLVNPAVRGWINYYGRFYRSQCVRVLSTSTRCWPHGRGGSTNGCDVAGVPQPTGWGALRGGTRRYSCCGPSGGCRRPDRKSRMRREPHVRFREGAGVKFPRATRPVIFSRAPSGSKPASVAARPPIQPAPAAPLRPARPPAPP